MRLPWLAEVLRLPDHKISPDTIGKLLTKPGFSRQVNRKTKEGADHRDRDAQFLHINDRVEAARNVGSDYRPENDPCKVNTHDFPDREKGKVAPYGVYDIADNTDWVPVVPGSTPPA